MKILLFYPKWTGTYGIFSHFAKKSSVIPPLNLAYIAAVAEKEHDVKIVDCELEDISEEKLLEIIGEYQPHLIGTTSTTPTAHFTVRYARKIKENFDIPIAIGGSHITILKEKAFEDCFDYGFIGESEESWRLFLENSIRDKRKLYNEIPIDINSIKPPALHLLKMDRYHIGTMRGVKRIAPIMTLRGCPFKCIFCATNVFGSKVRRRDIDLVFNEISMAVDKFHTEHFIIIDDTFTIDKQYILDLCKLIKPLGITFEGGSRANLVDEELISSMAGAGLIRFSFGLESVNSEIRRIIRKEVPLEAYTTANRLTNKYGIETLNSCMIGLPGETIDTIRETLHFLRCSREVKQANLAIAIPYPGTELYDMAVRGDYRLLLNTNDFSKFWRYGSAVMNVGDLTPKDLLQLQNDAFVSIYLAPWRWMPVIRKQGIVGFMLTFFRLLKSLGRIIVNKNGFFRFKKCKGGSQCHEQGSVNGKVA